MRARGPSIAALVTALVVLSTASLAHAFQQAPDSPSPASDTAHVTAQGVVMVGESDLIWRVSERTAPLPANVDRTTSDLGFLIVTSGVVLIDDLAHNHAVAPRRR